MATGWEISSCSIHKSNISTIPNLAEDLQDSTWKAIEAVLMMSKDGRNKRQKQGKVYALTHNEQRQHRLSLTLLYI